MSVVRVRHLDCCSMCPRIGAVNAENRFVGHVLVVETAASGVVVVDTGIGDAARREPARYLGRGFAVLFNPDREPSRSLRAQLVALGLADDVRHIVLTHLDGDHAGGIADFPRATVHVHQRELEAANRRRSFNERIRYRPILWEHRPRFATYDDGGDEWFGFPAVRTLEGLPDDIVAVPLTGHTRGHAAIAVRDGERWLMHCGDGYFHQGIVDPSRPPPTRAVTRFETRIAIDRGRVAANHERLRELVASRQPGLSVFSAHDPDEFQRLAAPAT